MAAYLLLLVAVLSRFIPPLMPHAGWMNFTAVTGALLYFGARRPGREMFVPLGALMLSDLLLTTFVYHYPFAWQGYLPTWTWYIAGTALGWILLKSKTTFWRVGAGVVLGPTSFWILSNYAVWATGGNGYPHTEDGLWACFMAGIPFYRNDLASAAIVSGLAFGVPVLVRRMNASRAVAQVAK
ncbi:MAG TPA: DUF6580 family putative transport protein [Terracidiphilus sp.]|nr:DUF6580 family putative transport protein [Terracidiphilus sp.]